MTRRTELLALAEMVERGETEQPLITDIDDALLKYELRPVRKMPGMPDWIQSIDAQTALPARIRSSSLCLTDGTIWVAETETVSETGHYIGAYAPTEPSARLAALLRAMAEDGE